ncbi:NUDIX domain-containing protein [Streptomyces sp. NPDC017529]|uniref:NUDIX domain-containing protein n=1 Tax=Streptomyces sp. NPDC017529 TaxID=3365000 RepID=UPI0037AA9B98
MGFSLPNPTSKPTYHPVQHLSQEKPCPSPTRSSATPPTSCVIRGRHFLAIDRDWDPYEGYLALPGGHVDRGETAPMAAVRELAEETGVHVAKDDLTLIDIYEDPDRDPRGRYVSAAFVVTVPKDTTPPSRRRRPRRALDAAGPGRHHHPRLRPQPHSGRRPAPPGSRRIRPPVAAETDTGRCPAAHPSDPSRCDGPLAVTVTDSSTAGAGVDGCERHAARMLASLAAGHVYTLPDAPPRRRRPRTHHSRHPAAVRLAPAAQPLT